MKCKERLCSLGVYFLQATALAAALSHHLMLDHNLHRSIPDLLLKTQIAALVTSIVSTLFLCGVMCVELFYNNSHRNRKKTLACSMCTITSLCSSVLNATLLKQTLDVSIVALSCLVAIQVATFIACFIWFEFQKQCFPISEQLEEDQVSMLHLIPEPESHLQRLTSRMQLKQIKLNKLKTKLQTLENTYRHTNSPELLVEINETTKSIQKSIRKIAAIRESIRSIEEEHRLPPPPYSQWMNSGDTRLDSSLARTNSSTEITIEREREIRELERKIRAMQFKVDVLNLKLNTEGLLEEEKVSLLLELKELQKLIEKDRTRLGYLLEPSTLPSYSSLPFLGLEVETAV